MKNKFLLSIGLIILLVMSNTLNAQETWKFSFGVKNNIPSFTSIDSNEPYTGENGFGFDFVNIDKVKIHSNKNGYCSADVPFYFSAKVPEGTYEVLITFGAKKHASETTVKAESKRIMLTKIKTAEGQEITKSITVNVRSTKIDASKSIRLKQRSLEYLNWDDKLTLEFSGNYPAIKSIEIRPKKKYTTLFLAGDSTVTDQDGSPYASWGQLITNYVSNDLSVANYAESGASLVSFKSTKRLDKVIGLMKKGDYLFIEFGHNDQKRKGDGIGPWTSFTDLLTEFITKAREKGGIPVLLTPTQRRSFDKNRKIKDTHKEYPAAMRKVAKDLAVPLIDLHAMTRTLYEIWGPKLSKKAFVQYPANTFPGQDKRLKDNSHFNEFGANEIALCVLKGIIDKDLSIKPFLLDAEFMYSPAAPNNFKDWDLMMSPRYRITKPKGN